MLRYYTQVGEPIRCEIEEEEGQSECVCVCECERERERVALSPCSLRTEAC